MFLSAVMSEQVSEMDFTLSGHDSQNAGSVLVCKRFGDLRDDKRLTTGTPSSKLTSII